MLSWVRLGKEAFGLPFAADEALIDSGWVKGVIVLFDVNAVAFDASAVVFSASMVAFVARMVVFVELSSVCCASYPTSVSNYAREYKQDVPLCFTCSHKHARLLVRVHEYKSSLPELVSSIAFAPSPSSNTCVHRHVSVSAFRYVFTSSRSRSCSPSPVSATKANPKDIRMHTLSTLHVRCVYIISSVHRVVSGSRYAR